ncbi:MAG: NAD(P)/FAD-dependent oxidoreductase [Actinobacteria bacterium]|nr:NAD(P)/FAD-dependent oxidoreductase [Actinomycetota bacterium]
MSTGYDAVIIGAGHNGLVTAGLLSKAGLSTLVVERAERIGGALGTTDELAPGVRVPVLSHSVGRMSPSVANNLRLYDHGLRLIQPEVRVWAPQLEGTALTLWGDAGRTAEELRSRSAHDADAYPAFDARVRALAEVLGLLNELTPPSAEAFSAEGAIGAMRFVQGFRGLDKKDAQTLMRVLPMAAADFTGEYFDTDALRALLAFRGVLYASMGPWSAGTTALLLGDSGGNGGGAPGPTVFVEGGPAALAAALASAARTYGAQIRTGAEVAGITADSEGKASGVALVSGEEIEAAVVVSGADPKRTLRLVDPIELGPTLRWRAENIRTPGVTAKVNLVLAGVPHFPALGADGDRRRLQGRIVFAPSIDWIEGAFDASKYGRVPESPPLEATFPTLVDPQLASEGRQVISIVVQYAPYAVEGDWDSGRDELGDRVIKTLDGFAPGIADLILERQVITPLDLERDYGLTGGHALHAEPSLDQFFAWRPLWGHADYRMGIPGLYLCGSGAHPGGGITGRPGANAAREVLADHLRRQRRSE